MNVGLGGWRGHQPSKIAVFPKGTASCVWVLIISGRLAPRGSVRLIGRGGGAGGGWGGGGGGGGRVGGAGGAYAGSLGLAGRVSIASRASIVGVPASVGGGRRRDLLLYQERHDALLQ